MSKPTHILCFSCAAFASDTDNQPTLICSECSFTIERENYQRLINYASDVVEYGYHYRKSYEEDYRQGEFNSRYQISFDEIWVFVTLAVLSGVIGNAAYDLVKAAIRKMLSRKAEVANTFTFEMAMRDLEDEREFRIFIKYVQDFHNHKLQGLPYEVASAIAEEMYVDELAKLLDKDVDDKPRPISEDDLIEKHRLAVEALKAKQKPKTRDFEGLWEKLRDSELIEETAGRDKRESNKPKMKVSSSLRKKRKKRNKKSSGK